MARAYSLDLRKRVVAAVASGQTCRAVAERFGVSVASVVKWSQRFRATGSAAAKPIEQVFAKLKTLLRKAAERTVGASARSSNASH